MNKSLDYRPDIDGLRGWAVILVIIFHLDPSLLTGGFTSLDLFFVISGFLITRNIVKDAEQSKFSFRRFYTRRLRRLFPAHFVTLVGVFIAGAFLLSPQYFMSMAQSIMAICLISANFHFWSESGYFDLTTEVRPLLHTWSLSLEEQYYFVWPFLLIMLLRFGRERWVILFLVTASVASIACAEIWARMDSGAAYYLLPSRMFEFMFGSLMVWVVRYRVKSAKLLEALTVLGIVLIALPLFFYTKKIPFPGLSALPSVLGTCLLIYCGSTKYAGRVLNNRPMIWVGLISYSLYLVHWPIIVFYRYLNPEGLTVYEQAGIMAASITLAALMYRLVETPFRYPRGQRPHKSSRPFVATCAGLLVLVGATAIHAYKNEGWLWRVPSEIREAVARAETDRHLLYNLGTCHFFNKEEHRKLFYKNIDLCLKPVPGKKNFLLMGDSHAGHFSYGFRKIFPEINFLQATHGMCHPFVKQNNHRRLCVEIMEYVFKEHLPKQKGIDGVILMGAWTRKEHIKKLSKTIDYLKSIGHTPILFGPVTFYNEDVPVLIIKYGHRQGLEDYLAQHARSHPWEIDELARKLAAEKGIEYVSTPNLLCPNGKCVIFYDGAPVQYDRAHFTIEGSEFMARQIRAHTSFWK